MPAGVRAFGSILPPDAVDCPFDLRLGDLRRRAAAQEPAARVNYQQAAIREKEMPLEGHSGAGLMTLSEGARVFTRSSYADLLREDRGYTIR